jgi:thymidine phosphorylase
MLVQAGLASTTDEGRDIARLALSSGQAMDSFARMVHALGGPADFCERSQAYLPNAPVILEVSAPSDGYLAACDGRALGLAVVDMGGGRRKTSDMIDHRVGFDRILPLGSAIEKGQPIARVHAVSSQQADQAIRALLASYSIEANSSRPSPVIIERIA